jgi:Pectate lyase superfamily protein
VKAPDIQRRLFLVSAVGALALRPSSTVQADTAFTNFKFAATGAPTARTMPDRLSDIINIKDWGALGNNTADDLPAIQAAIDYCISIGGGKVIFPAGTYRLLSGPKRLVVGSSNNVRVELVGCGQQSTIIICSPGAGLFAISSQLASGTWAQYDNIGCLEGLCLVTHGAASPNACGVKVTNESVVIRDTQVEGCFVGFDTSAARNVHMYDCNASYGLSNPTNIALPDLPGAFPGTVGFYIGSNSSCQNVRSQGTYEICFALSGYAPSILACSCENHKIGVRVGWAPSFTAATSALAGTGTNALPFSPLPSSGLIVGRVVSDPGNANIPAGTTITGVNSAASTVLLSNNLTGNVSGGTTITFQNETPAYGFVVANHQTEACDVAIDFWNCQGGFVTGMYTQGQISSLATFAPISAITYPGSGAYGAATARVTTAANHHIPAGQHRLQISAPAGFVPAYGNPPGWIIATSPGPNSNTFDYYLPGRNPGSYRGGAGWMWPQYYTYRFRNVSETAIIASGCSQNSPIGSVDFAYRDDLVPYTFGVLGKSGGDANVRHRNNVLWGMIAIDGYIQPANKNIAGWNFKHAGGVACKLDGIAGEPSNTVSAPVPAMTFVGLPGNAGVYQDGPYEGQEFNITDGQKSASPGVEAGFNDVVIGGAGGHYRVRYDGSVWRRVA